jgi:hypothetical protein
MIDLFAVRPDEPRGLRLFSLAVTRADLDRLQAILAAAEPGMAEGYLADLLGVRAIDATRVEVFDLADLSGFGLVNYLTKANGLPEEALAPDRATLEALKGVVMVIYPRAFRGEAVILSPAPVVTAVGAWDEDIPDLEFTPLQSEAAQGELLPGAPAAPPAPTPRWIYWLSATMVLLAVLGLWAAFQGGV